MAADNTALQSHEIINTFYYFTLCLFHHVIDEKRSLGEHELLRNTQKSNYLVLTKTIMTPNFIAVVYISKNLFFLNSAVDIP